MKRRIIKLGQSTYVMSLPRKWLQAQGLEKGDYLDVNEEAMGLFVARAGVPRRGEEVSLDINVSDYNDRTIIIVLTQAYRKGFDRVNLTIGEPSQMAFIRRLTKEVLLGFEVVSESQNRCVIQNIAEPAAEKFDVVLRKLLILFEEEAKEIYGDLANGRSNLSKREETKEMFDNFNNYCRRAVIRNRAYGPQNSYLVFYFLSQLSLAQHDYYYLYKQCVSQRKVDKFFLEKLSASIDAYHLLYEAFFRKDIDLAHQAHHKADVLQKEILDYASRKKVDAAWLHLIKIVRLLGGANTAIFGIAFPNLVERL